MKLERFKWRVLKDTSPSVEYRVEEISFGDGYEQVVGDGINTDKSKYSLSVLGDKKTTKEVIGFLNRHRGVTPFLFEHPTLGEGVFRCTGFSLDDLSTTHSIVKFSIKQAYV